ncbi:DUF6178 family protein [Desulfospira joergensenii]|uniref:DUF6178 family protein n=1 Tax=Desulfospira joergensenii TaxID=53329 RepID=UPI0003B46154|nr:DUF6178 family protein [Desulfospira joergensenii]
MTQNHKIANLQQRELKLRALRRDILSKDSETALDMILEAPSPATLVQSFPDQDLYYLMHKIGPHDFIPVLALARSDQWEHVLDVEVWDDDRLNTDIMAKAFDFLFQADPERFLRWIITEKPDYFEFFLLKNMIIHIREHDEPPPEDSDAYITLDDKFYFRFPEQKSPEQKNEEGIDLDEPDPEKSQADETPELIEKMMKKLADMDLSVFHGLLLEVLSLLPAETEEEQFRLRNLRLAEKGFLPAHEAIGIYQPTDFKSLRKRSKTDIQNGYHPDIPLPPQFFSLHIQGDDLFVRALARIPQELFFSLESEMAALTNKIISADRIRIREKDAIRETVEKASAFLSLGLEVILSSSEKPAKITGTAAGKIIETYFLEDIFRTGSRAGIRLKTRAQNWYKDSFLMENSLPLSFLSENFLGVIGGLFLDRPLYFDNYQTGKLYRNFKTLGDIEETKTSLDQIISLDKTLGKIKPDLTSFRQGVLTYKSMLLTLWARNRIGLDREPEAAGLDPIPLEKFKPFFKEMFSGPGDEDAAPKENKDLVLNDLILWAADAAGSEPDPDFKNLLSKLVLEIEEEYGRVNPDQLDPRFTPHFLIRRENA